MTTWFQKRAGSEVHEGIDDESMTLLGDCTPNWVRLPPELGGHQVPVLGEKVAPCPRCKGHVRHLLIGDNLGVAECSRDGFLWYRASV